MPHFDLDRVLRIVVALTTIWFPAVHISQHLQSARKECSSVRQYVASAGTEPCEDDQSSGCPICQFLMGGAAHLVASTGCSAGRLVDEVFLPEAVDPSHHLFRICQPRAPPFPIAPLV